MNTVIALEPVVVEASEATREALPPVSPKACKPRVWTAFVTLIAAQIVGSLFTFACVIVMCIGIGFVLGAQGVAGPAIQTRLQEFLQQPLVSLLISLVPFQLGMAAVVWFAARRSQEPIRQRLGFLPQTGRTLSMFKLTTMAGFTVAIALASVIVTSLLLDSLPASTPVAGVVSEGSLWSISLLSIVMSMIPALVEESLFRGYLQRRFLERWSPAVAIGMSTLLFALMHMDSPQHIIAVVPLGLITGLLAYRTHSIKPGMLVHAMHNMAVVGFAALVAALKPHLGQEQLGLMVLGAIGVLSLVGLPAVVSLVRKAKPREVVELPIVAEPIVESPSVRSRALSLPNFAIDSRLASGAV